MVKREYIVFFTIFLMSISFSLANEAIGQRQDGQINSEYIISQPCATCSYINISVFTKDGIILDNVPMVNNGTSWTYNFTPSTTLRHDVNGIGDKNGVDDSFAFWFDVTLSGNEANNSTIIANFLLFLFLFGLMIVLIYFHSRIDFEKWHDKILKRYSDKNPVKVFISGIGYSFMKDGFYVYYLLGWPIIMIILDVAFTFNISSIYSLFSSLVDIYSVGLIIVGLTFVGSAYQFLKETFDSFSDLKWGIEK